MAKAAPSSRGDELSAWLDSTVPIVSLAGRGGKLIAAIGTDDAGVGAQLDYYQSVIDKMGRSRVDSFARFFVIHRWDTDCVQQFLVDGEGRTFLWP
jgi:feruloyl esterase